MKIWIENKEGFLEGYSLIQQPNLLEIEVEKEPTDFFNYHSEWDKLNLRS